MEHLEFPEPGLVKSPDFTALRESCQDYLDYCTGEDYCEDGADDYRNDVFEKAMGAFFGKGIWDYLNNHPNMS